MTEVAHLQRRDTRDRPFELAVTDNLEDLLAVLPPRIVESLEVQTGEVQRGELIEIVMDLGRRPEARFQDTEITLGEQEVSREELFYVAERIGQFGEDNRAGIERTLHRISAIRNRTGDLVGLTCRIGRAVYGTIAIIRELIESGDSILLLGRPGVGKTTMLREVARVLSDDLGKRVIVVDTSNEIAGDGDIPHPAIGRARRMQVPTPNAQHAVMIEAVENHMPEVIVIDEIGTELEAMAARTIAERGVQLIGTAHGNTLENLMMNPTLTDLIGGIQSVTLSDEEARRRGTQKSILERKAPPTFSIMVELISRDEVAVHHDVAGTVDAILRGATVRPELRRRNEDGDLEIERPQSDWRDAVVTPFPSTRGGDSGRRRPRSAGQQEPAIDLVGTGTAHNAAQPEPDRSAEVASLSPGVHRRVAAGKGIRIYPFGVSRNRLEQAIGQLGLNAAIVRDPKESDVVITLKNYFRTKPQPIRDAEMRGIPVYVLRSNTLTQMESALSGLMPPPVQSAEQESDPEPQNPHPPRPLISALEEAEDAIGAVIQGAPRVALAPQAKYVRRLQHELAERYNLPSRSKGREPNRRVEILRGEFG